MSIFSREVIKSICLGVAIIGVMLILGGCSQPIDTDEPEQPIDPQASSEKTDSSETQVGA